MLRNTGWVVSVDTTGAAPRRIVAATTQNGVTGCGSVWIDCSYEGDLVRLSGTAHRVGREAMSEFNESMAGQDWPPFVESFEKPDAMAASVHPFTDNTNTTLHPGILEVYNGTHGAADDWVMSMCFRMCLTNNASNAVPIAPPLGYSVEKLSLLRQEILAATARGFELTLDSMFLVRYLPNSKIDLNSGSWTTQNHSGGYFPFSTDLPFAQHDWPLGDPAARARVFTEHKWWTAAMLHYLGTDPELRRIQPGLVASVGAYGLCGDEYMESAHWSPQLYVRESVRLVADRVISQDDICVATPNPTTVGLSEWAVDIHIVKRVAFYNTTSDRWAVVNSGGRDSGRAGHTCGVVLEVPYEAIVPQRSDTANLLVPVCASFTHVAFSTFRLEPQYAIFGQSAAVAAALAIRDDAETPTVHAVNITELQALLVAQGQLLHSAHPPPPPSPPMRWGCSQDVDRCVGGIPGAAAPNATCADSCQPLGPDEWLAQMCCDIWSAPDPSGAINAKSDTFLKKSVLESADLPAVDKLEVTAGSTCRLVPNTARLGTYALCKTS